MKVDVLLFGGPLHNRMWQVPSGGSYVVLRYAKNPPMPPIYKWKAAESLDATSFEIGVAVYEFAFRPLGPSPAFFVYEHATPEECEHVKDVALNRLVEIFEALYPPSKV